MKKIFLNEYRTRYYGLRVGDIVKAKPVGYNESIECTVVELIPMDNNSVMLKDNNNRRLFEWVAEWCEIITKVENITK